MNAATLISSAIEEVLTPSVKLAPILLKIKAIAHLLKNEELKQWAELELNGYANSEATAPEYRRIHAAPMVDLIHERYAFNQSYESNMPMLTDHLDEQDWKALNTARVANSLADIEEMINSDGTPRMHISQYLCDKVSQRVYRPNGWHIHRAWQHVSKTQLHGLLASIRSKLLDLLLQLDSLGADAFIPSLITQPHVKEKIEQAVQSITAPNGVVNLHYGDNGQQTTSTGKAAQLTIAQGDNATQSITNGPALLLPELLAQIKEAFAADPAFKQQREEIEDEFQRIEGQLHKAQPKKNILKRSVESLQEIAKGGAAVQALGELLIKAYEQIEAYT